MKIISKLALAIMLVTLCLAQVNAQDLVEKTDPGSTIPVVEDKQKIEIFNLYKGDYKSTIQKGISTSNRG